MHLSSICFAYAWLAVGWRSGRKIVKSQAKGVVFNYPYSKVERYYEISDKMVTLLSICPYRSIVQLSAPASRSLLLIIFVYLGSNKLNQQIGSFKIQIPFILLTLLLTTIAQCARVAVTSIAEWGISQQTDLTGWQAVAARVLSELVNDPEINKPIS